MAILDDIAATGLGYGRSRGERPRLFGGLVRAASRRNFGDMWGSSFVQSPERSMLEKLWLETRMREDDSLSYAMNNRRSAFARDLFSQTLGLDPDKATDRQIGVMAVTRANPDEIRKRGVFGALSDVDSYEFERLGSQVRQNLANEAGRQFDENRDYFEGLSRLELRISRALREKKGRDYEDLKEFFGRTASYDKRFGDLETLWNSDKDTVMTALSGYFARRDDIDPKERAAATQLYNRYISEANQDPSFLLASGGMSGTRFGRWVEEKTPGPGFLGKLAGGIAGSASRPLEWAKTASETVTPGDKRARQLDEEIAYLRELAYGSGPNSVLGRLDPNKDSYKINHLLSIASTPEEARRKLPIWEASRAANTEAGIASKYGLDKDLTDRKNQIELAVTAADSGVTIGSLFAGSAGSGLIKRAAKPVLTRLVGEETAARILAKPGINAFAEALGVTAVQSSMDVPLTVGYAYVSGASKDEMLKAVAMTAAADAFFGGMYGGTRGLIREASSAIESKNKYAGVAFRETGMAGTRYGLTYGGFWALGADDEDRQRWAAGAALVPLMAGMMYKAGERSGVASHITTPRRTPIEFGRMSPQSIESAMDVRARGGLTGDTWMTEDVATHVAEDNRWFHGTASPVVNPNAGVDVSIGGAVLASSEVLVSDPAVAASRVKDMGDPNLKVMQSSVRVRKVLPLDQPVPYSLRQTLQNIILPSTLYAELGIKDRLLEALHSGTMGDFLNTITDAYERNPEILKANATRAAEEARLLTTALINSGYDALIHSRAQDGRIFWEMFMLDPMQKVVQREVNKKLNPRRPYPLIEKSIVVEDPERLGITSSFDATIGPEGYVRYKSARADAIDVRPEVRAETVADIQMGASDPNNQPVYTPDGEVFAREIPADDPEYAEITARLNPKAVDEYLPTITNEKGAEPRKITPAETLYRFMVDPNSPINQRLRSIPEATWRRILNGFKGFLYMTELRQAGQLSDGAVEAIITIARMSAGAPVWDNEVGAAIFLQRILPDLFDRVKRGESLKDIDIESWAKLLEKYGLSAGSEKWPAQTGKYSAATGRSFGPREVVKKDGSVNYYPGFFKKVDNGEWQEIVALFKDPTLTGRQKRDILMRKYKDLGLSQKTWSWALMMTGHLDVLPIDRHDVLLFFPEEINTIKKYLLEKNPKKYKKPVKDEFGNIIPPEDALNGDAYEFFNEKYLDRAWLGGSRTLYETVEDALAARFKGTQFEPYGTGLMHWVIWHTRQDVTGVPIEHTIVGQIAQMAEAGLFPRSGAPGSAQAKKRIFRDTMMTSTDVSGREWSNQGMDPDEYRRTLPFFFGAAPVLASDINDALKVIGEREAQAWLTEVQDKVVAPIFADTGIGVQVVDSMDLKRGHIGMATFGFFSPNTSPASRIAKFNDAAARVLAVLGLESGVTFVPDASGPHTAVQISFRRPLTGGELERFSELLNERVGDVVSEGHSLLSHRDGSIVLVYNPKTTSLSVGEWLEMVNSAGQEVMDDYLSSQPGAQFGAYNPDVFVIRGHTSNIEAGKVGREAAALGRTVPQRDISAAKAEYERLRQALLQRVKELAPEGKVDLSNPNAFNKPGFGPRFPWMGLAEGDTPRTSDLLMTAGSIAAPMVGAGLQAMADKEDDESYLDAFVRGATPGIFAGVTHTASGKVMGGLKSVVEPEPLPKTNMERWAASDALKYVRMPPELAGASNPERVLAEAIGKRTNRTLETVKVADGLEARRVQVAKGIEGWYFTKEGTNKEVGDLSFGVGRFGDRWYVGRFRNLQTNEPLSTKAARATTEHPDLVVEASFPSQEEALAYMRMRVTGQLPPDSSGPHNYYVAGDLDPAVYNSRPSLAQMQEFDDQTNEYLRYAEQQIEKPGVVDATLRKLGLGKTLDAANSIINPAARYRSHQARAVLVSVLAGANYLRTLAGYQSARKNELMQPLAPILGPERTGRKLLQQAAVAAAPAAAGYAAYEMTGDKEYLEGGVLAAIAGQQFMAGRQKTTRWSNRAWESIAYKGDIEELPEQLRSGVGKLYDILQRPEMYELTEEQKAALQLYNSMRERMVRETNAALEAAGIHDPITLHDNHGILQWFEPESIKQVLGERTPAILIETPGFDRGLAPVLRRQLGPTFYAALSRFPELRLIKDPEKMIELELKFHDQLRAQALVVIGLKKSGAGIAVPTTAELRNMDSAAAAQWREKIEALENAGWSKIPGIDDHLFSPQAVKAVNELLIEGKGREKGFISFLDATTNALRQLVFSSDLSAWTMQGAMLAINDPVGVILNAHHLIGATVFGKKYFDWWVTRNRRLWEEFTKSGGIPGYEHSGLEKELANFSRIPVIGGIESRGFEAFLPIHRALMFKALKEQETFINRLAFGNKFFANRMLTEALRNGPAALGVGAVLADVDIPGIDDDWEKFFYLALGLGGAVHTRHVVSRFGKGEDIKASVLAAKHVNRTGGTLNKQMYGITTRQSQIERTIFFRSPALTRNAIILATRALTDFGPEGAMARYYLFKTALLLGAGLAALQWAVTGRAPNLDPTDNESIYNPLSRNFMKADLGEYGTYSPSNPLISLVRAVLKTNPPDGQRTWRYEDWIPMIGLAEWYRARESDLMGGGIGAMVYEAGTIVQKKFGGPSGMNTGEDYKPFKDNVLHVPLPLVLQQGYEAGLPQRTELGAKARPVTDWLGLKENPAIDSTGESLAVTAGSFLGVNANPETIGAELVRRRNEVMRQLFPTATDRNGDGFIDYQDLNEEQQAKVREILTSEPKWKDLQERAAKAREEKGQPSPIDEYIKAKQAAYETYVKKIEEIDKAYTSGKISAMTAKSMYQRAAEERRDNLRWAEQLLGNLSADRKGTKETVQEYLKRNQKPEDAAVDRYFDLFSLATRPDGKLDFDKLEILQKQYLKSLDPETRAYVERRVTSGGEKTASVFLKDYEKAKELAKPYWDLADEVFQRYAGSGVFFGFKSYTEFELALRDYAEASGVSPDEILNVISEDRTYRAFKNALSDARAAYLLRNPDAAKYMKAFWGIEPPEDYKARRRPRRQPRRFARTDPVVYQIRDEMLNFRNMQYQLPATMNG